MNTIAVISPGNMGHAVGRLLGSRGFAVVTSFAGRSPRTRGLAERAGIRDLGSIGALVAEADLVLSIMPPAAAVVAAQEVAAAMTAAGVAPPYADCNAIAPATTQRIAALIGAGRRPLHRRRHHRRAAGQRQRAAVVRLRPGRPTCWRRLPAAASWCATWAARSGARRRSRCATPRSPRAPPPCSSPSSPPPAGSAWTRRWPPNWPTARPPPTPACGAPCRGCRPGRRAGSEEMRQIAATFEAVGVPGDFHRGAARPLRAAQRHPIRQRTGGGGGHLPHPGDHRRRP